jgi:hypothetical protein
VTPVATPPAPAPCRPPTSAGTCTPSIAIPAAASVAVRHLVQGPPRRLRVHAAFPRALYLATTGPGVPNVVLSVVTADGVVPPDGVTLVRPAASRPLRAACPGSSVEVGKGQVWLPGGTAVRVTRWWHPRPALAATSPVVLAGRAELAAGVLEQRDLAPAWSRGSSEPTSGGANGRTPVAGTGLDPAGRGRLHRLSRALADGRPAAASAAAHTLLGSGPGLTPAGDDVLAGLFAGVALFAGSVGLPHGHALVTGARALGEALVRLAPTATTAISAAMLAHAVHGAVTVPAGDLVRALTGAGDLEHAASALTRVGATSGRALGIGVVTAARLAAHAASVAGRVDREELR